MAAMPTMNAEAELNAKAASQEPFEQRMAFEAYYKMGDERSLVKLSEQIQRHRVTVEEWSRKFRWVSRVKERERQAAEFQLMISNAQEEASRKKTHIEIIDSAIGMWVQKLADKTIVLKSVDDLEKLVNLRWKLAGMPDKVIQHNHSQHFSGSIDLNLKDMGREQLLNFLHEMMHGIRRVMERPALTNRPSITGQTIDAEATLSAPGPAGSPGELDLNIDDEMSLDID